MNLTDLKAALDACIPREPVFDLDVRFYYTFRDNRIVGLVAQPRGQLILEVLNPHRIAGGADFAVDNDLDATAVAMLVYCGFPRDAIPGAGQALAARIWDKRVGEQCDNGFVNVQMKR